MLKYAKVNIRRSELAIQSREVPAWEVPILESMFLGGVEHIDDVYVDKDAPSASEEFERLASKYRQSTEEDGSKGPIYVAAVYGQFGAGIRALGAAIADATVDDAPEGAKVRRPTRKRVRIGDLF